MAWGLQGAEESYAGRYVLLYRSICLCLSIYCRPGEYEENQTSKYHATVAAHHLTWRGTYFLWFTTDWTEYMGHGSRFGKIWIVGLFEPTAHSNATVQQVHWTHYSHVPILGNNGHSSHFCSKSYTKRFNRLYNWAKNDTQRIQACRGNKRQGRRASGLL